MHTLANTIRVMLIVGFAFLLAGCAATSPKEAFFKRHPDERTKYVRLDEASPAVIADFEWQMYQSKISALKALCEYFPQYADVTNYAGLVRARVEQFREGEKKFEDELASDFDPKTDHLFYFVFRDGNYEESGWLILRHDNIHKKYWTSKGVNYQ